MAGSLDDILTAAKNIVTAINGAAQTYLSVNGNQIAGNITATTLIKSGAGRIATCSIVVAGNTTGTIYDGASTSATTLPLFTIPDTLGIVTVNLPVLNGIVVTPGTGQTVSIGFS